MSERSNRPLKAATQKLGSIFAHPKMGVPDSSFLILGPATGSTDSFPDVSGMTRLPTPSDSPLMQPIPSPPGSPPTSLRGYPFTSSKATDFNVIVGDAKPRARMMGRGGAGSKQRAVLSQHPHSQPQTPTKSAFFPPSPTSSLFPEIDLPSVSQRLHGRGGAGSRVHSPEPRPVAKRSKSHPKIISTPTLVYSSNLELASPTASSTPDVRHVQDASAGRSDGDFSPTSTCSDIVTPTSSFTPTVHVVTTPAQSPTRTQSDDEREAAKPAAPATKVPKELKKRPAHLVFNTPAIPDFLSPTSPSFTPPSKGESPREGYFSPQTPSSLPRSATPITPVTPTHQTDESRTAGAPRKSWIGRWNGQDLQDVMHKLRLLR